MATSLLDLIRIKAHQALIRAAEDALADHLHNTAVTLSDVEAILPRHSWNPRSQHPITPSLSWNRRIMGKLAANIGLNTSRGRISAADLEAMKVHISTHGDEKNWLLSCVNEQVKRFKAQSEEYTLSKLTEKQEKQRAHQERLRVQQEEKAHKKEAKELARFRAAFPKEWHDPLESSSYDTLVDMFIDTYGLAWDKIPKPPSWKKWIDPLGVGTFAMTRLNSGPGLNARKKPQVRIPTMTRKLPRRKLPITGIEELLCAQTQTMSLSETCFCTKKSRKRIVLQLPPR
ncbi:hypothetical protein DE146DRAFT_295319 [Phaeosphaeria sp. MPI-PUGE-AT-0046c]|nr:hypothetical protein DE146DRAFT_295319 [Phaeosphaeria sp. MPI-PUGE-AT-0046c]